MLAKAVMKELFREIMDIEGVKGAMLVSLNGELVYKEFVGQAPIEAEDKNFWVGVFDSLHGVKECEVLSAASRLYIRETPLGYLLISMEPHARIALIRLNCDILAASIEDKKAPKARWGLFKKKK